jgi:hypothetical protein
LDIEVAEARIFALQSDYVDEFNEWTETAKRKDNEAQGVFNAMINILPNWTNYEVSAETYDLLDKVIEKKQELEQLEKLQLKEVA